MKRPTKPQWDTITKGKLPPARARACIEYAKFRTNEIATLLRVRLDQFENEISTHEVYALSRDLNKSFGQWITDAALFVGVRKYYDDEGNFRTSP